MKCNTNGKTHGPRGMLSFRPAEPIDQMIKLETAARQSARPHDRHSTATQVIADAVARLLGGKYRSQAAAWRKLLSRTEGVDSGQIPVKGPRANC